MPTLPDETFFHLLADKAGAVILPHFRAVLDVKNKSDDRFDPVTVADKSAESVIRAEIRAMFPQHGILGEEEGAERLDASHVWVIDPIDGTRAFITGLPTWGVLIGLQHQGRSERGLMSQPFTGERFFGDGTSARYRGPDGERPLKTRRCSDLSQATVLTTTPALFNDQERVLYDAIEADARLNRYGLDCYGYAMVASGFADIVLESGLQAYDIAALIPVIEGAGGRVTNWQGEPADQGGQVLATGDLKLHDLVLRRLNP